MAPDSSNACSDFIIDMRLDLPSVDIVLRLPTCVVEEVIQKQRLENVSTTDDAEKDVGVGVEGTKRGLGQGLHQKRHRGGEGRNGLQHHGLHLSARTLVKSEVCVVRTRGLFRSKIDFGVTRVQPENTRLASCTGSLQHD